MPDGSDLLLPVQAPDAGLVTHEQLGDETPYRQVSTPHLSFSQVSMYLRCSMQYYFRYVQKLKDRPNLPIAIGKGGHAALEWNTKHKIATGKDHATADLIDKANDLITAVSAGLTPEDLNGKNAGTEKDKALNAIKLWRLTEAPAIRPIAAELELNLDLNTRPDYIEPIRIVNMKIDTLEEDLDLTTPLYGGETMRVKIIDDKFTSKKKSQSEIDLSTQLSLYLKGLHALTGKYATKVGMRMFGNTKEGPYAQTIYRAAAEMTPEKIERRFARLHYVFSKVEAAIKAGVFIPTDNPQTCGWCGFRDRCQSSLVDDFEARLIQLQTNPPADLA